MRGRYMAVFGLSVSVPAAIGPLAAGIVLDNYQPNLLWYLSALLCAISASGFYALHVKLGAQPRFARPPRAPSAHRSRWRRSMGEMEISPIAHVIQLSVAPVFLLSGIGAILAVMTNRLGRIIDRARTLETQLENAAAGTRLDARGRPRDPDASRAVDRSRDHAVHRDSIARMHGDRRAVPERVSPLRRVRSGRAALRRGDARVLPGTAVVSERDFRGDEQPSHCVAEECMEEKRNENRKRNNE